MLAILVIDGKRKNNVWGNMETNNKEKRDLIKVINLIIDELMIRLELSELLVFLVIFRKTLANNTLKQQISLTQFTKLTGLVRSSVIRAIKGLKEKKLVEKTIGGPKGPHIANFKLILNTDKYIKNFFKGENNE